MAFYGLAEPHLRGLRRTAGGWWLPREDGESACSACKHGERPRGGGADGARYELKSGPQSIGRETGEICFPDDPFISPKHARLTLENGQLTVEDLDSENGVFIRIKGPVSLKVGEEFLAGEELLVLEEVALAESFRDDDDTFYFVIPAGAARTVSTTFLFGDDGDLFLQLFNADEMVLASTADIQRGNSKQCIIIPAANVARGFFVRAVPLAINRIQQDDERLDYRLRIIDGEDCEVIPPETPGVNWPVAVDE